VSKAFRDVLPRVGWSEGRSQWWGWLPLKTPEKVMKLSDGMGQDSKEGANRSGTRIAGKKKKSLELVNQASAV
jgi:hypothetical protein